jgi:hypothetical protein
MPSAAIVPFATWGRTHQDGGGKSKWHLLLDLRRYDPVGGRRYGRAGEVFAPTMCGQALPDLEYGPAQNPKGSGGFGVATNLVLPGTGAVCQDCRLALARELDSFPI